MTNASIRQDGKPQHTGPSHPSTKSQLSVACTLLVSANIRATTRRYRKVRHTQVALRHAIVWQLCYPSKMAPSIVVKLAFSPWCHFFNGRFAILYPIIWKTENAGDYPIGIHHPWHVTNGSSVDATGGRRSQINSRCMMAAATREI